MDIKEFNIICHPFYKRNFLIFFVLPFFTKIVNLAAYISSYIILIKYFVYEEFVLVFYFGFFVCLLVFLEWVYKIHIRKEIS